MPAIAVDLRSGRPGYGVGRWSSSIGARLIVPSTVIGPSLVVTGMAIPAIEAPVSR
jgi:hypothetical protein